MRLTLHITATVQVDLAGVNLMSLCPSVCCVLYCIVLSSVMCFVQELYRMLKGNETLC